MLESIDNNDSLISAALKISKRNLGAINVTMGLIQEYEFGGIALCHLEDLGITGSDICIGYKDYCKQDLKKFYDLVMSRDEDMVKFIESNK